MMTFPATLQAGESSQTSEQLDEEHDESHAGADETASAADPGDESVHESEQRQTERRTVRTHIPMAPRRGDDMYSVVIRATETTEIPLHEHPDKDSDVVDHLPLEEDERLGYGSSRQVVEGSLEAAPAPTSLRVSHIGPDESMSDTAPTDEIEQGEHIAIIVVGWSDPCGGSWGRPFIWHDGHTYAREDDSPEYWHRNWDTDADDDSDADAPDPLPDTDFGAYHSTRQRVDYPDTDSAQNQWWKKVEGPDQEGWVLIEADELRVDSVPHHELAPNDDQ